MSSLRVNRSRLSSALFLSSYLFRHRRSSSLSRVSGLAHEPRLGLTLGLLPTSPHWHSSLRLQHYLRRPARYSGPDTSALDHCKFQTILLTKKLIDPRSSPPLRLVQSLNVHRHDLLASAEVKQRPNRQDDNYGTSSQHSAAIPRHVYGGRHSGRNPGGILELSRLSSRMPLEFLGLELLFGSLLQSVPECRPPMRASLRALSLGFSHHANRYRLGSSCR